MDPKDVMSSVAGQVKDVFESARRILTYTDWLDLFFTSPYSLSRCAPEYVADMLDHYGRREEDGRLGADT